MLSTVNWFLKRVAILWIVLTIVMITGALYSVHQSGGFH